MTVRGCIGAMVLSALALAAVDAAAQTTVESANTAFKDDVHAAAGLACTACHRTAAAGTFSAPGRTMIAPLCAGCHSDAALMRKFDPQVRVDQFLQYQTSAHGKRMASGDVRVATCSDCHGSHGIRRVRDTRSPVAPLNVVSTCGGCHGDAARMAPFGRTPAPPADWAASVHAAALVSRGDTSAPTCVSCHGSHGATPPGVTAVANVCAQCHQRETELFRASPKREIFDAIGQAECLVCHGNHRIESPADHWVGLEQGAVCEPCHDGSGESADAIRDVRAGLDALQAQMAAADALLTRAADAGMLVDEGRLALQRAREHQVQSRALVHAFARAPFAKTAAEGMAAARRAEEIGQTAMQELQFRRRGLGIATLVILAFLATLWMKIQRLPPA